MAGLYSAVPGDHAWTRTAGKRRKRTALRHIPWRLHSVQLLHFHHDLHVYGDLFLRSLDSGERKERTGFCGQRIEICRIFRIGWRSFRSGPAAGDFCVTDDGIWRREFP